MEVVNEANAMLIYLIPEKLMLLNKSMKRQDDFIYLCKEPLS